MRASPHRLMVSGALIGFVLLPSVASASERRSREVTREFQRERPCPSTGRTSGACPGFRKVRRLRIFGQRDKLKANRSKGA
jgi:hypothetical protein